MQSAVVVFVAVASLCVLDVVGGAGKVVRVVAGLAG